MRVESVQMISRSRQNHTSFWLANNMDSVPFGSAKKAYNEAIERFENAFTLDEAEELFSEAFRSE